MTQKRPGKPATGSKAVLYVDPSIPRGEGRGGGALRQKGHKTEFSIPGLAKHEYVLSLVKFRTVSFHYPSSEPRGSREKLKSRKGSRLECSLEINAWDIALTGLHTVRGTDSVWTAS